MSENRTSPRELLPACEVRPGHFAPAVVAAWEGVGRKSGRSDFPNDGGSQIFTPAKLQNRHRAGSGLVGGVAKHHPEDPALHRRYIAVTATGASTARTPGKFSAPAEGQRPCASRHPPGFEIQKGDQLALETDDGAITAAV